MLNHYSVASAAAAVAASPSTQTVPKGHKWDENAVQQAGTGLPTVTANGVTHANSSAGNGHDSSNGYNDPATGERTPRIAGIFEL